MMARDFRTELRREEEAWLASVTSAETQRLRARLDATLQKRQAANEEAGDESSPRTWLFGATSSPRAWLFAGVLAAMVVAVLSVWMLRGGEALGTFELLAKDGPLATRVFNGDVEIASGQATLLDRATGIEVRNQGPTALRRDEAGVRIVRGKARFQVQHRRQGAAPAVVLVSDGAIEVMGTQFTVTQRQGGGEVTLHEGAIRFRPLRGATVDLLPGQSLTWPLPEAPPPVALPAPIPEPGPPMPIAPSSPGRVRSADGLLQEVEVLRGRGEYETAVRKLSEGLRSQPSSRRERLSFELGSILTHQLHDIPRACAHWRRHTREYSGGRYRQDVKRAQSALECPSR